jgi:hypothetical protein
MPAKSAAQWAAMAAAAHGKSNLGIPASVGREFVEATPASKRSAFARQIAKRRKRRKKSARFNQLASIAGGRQ